jgi:hypothetical protein
VITYYLKKRHMIGDLKLEVYDVGGKLLSTLPGGKRRGINRVEWTMRSGAPRTAPGAGIIPSLGALMGLRALPGTYVVKMVKGKDTYASSVTLVPEPGSAHSAADRALQLQTSQTLYGMVERLAYVVDALTDARDQAKAVSAAVPAREALRKRLDALVEAADRQRSALVSSQRGEGISGEEKLREEIGLLYGNVNGFEGRPTQSQLDRMAVLEGELKTAIAQYDALFTGEIAGVNAALVKKKLAPIVKLTVAGWDTRRPAQ